MKTHPDLPGHVGSASNNWFFNTSGCGVLTQ